MARLLGSLLACAFAALAVAGARPALAADYLTTPDSDSCARQAYLTTIQERFRLQTRNVPHLPDVQIAGFRNIHERRYLPESEDWPIERRYCAATVSLSNGRSREIWYLIEGRMGFAGIGRNVEFCVQGFDRWLAYNGRCRVLR